MNTIQNLSKQSLLALLITVLTACGGGEDDPTDPINPNPSEPPSAEVLVNSPEALAEAISFGGGQKVEGSIPSPDNPSGGTLTVTPEIAITSGGSTPFSLDVNLPQGHYVHAYLIQVQGTNSTFIVPVDANGQPQVSQQVAISDMIGQMSKTSSLQSLSAQASASVESAPTRHIMSCDGRPNLRFTARGYEAPVVVQAYVEPQMPVQGAAYDFSNFRIGPQYWTTPTTTKIKGVSVGNGSLQITLTWDTTADVDLHLVEPGGSTISYENRNSFAGDGYLDVDDTDGYGPENIFYDTEVPGGAYTVKVHMFSGYGDELPTNYTVTVKRNGTITTHRGTLGADWEEDVVTSFSMNGSSDSSSSSSSSSSSTSSGSGLDYGSCGLIMPGIASMCFTNYPTEACDTLAPTLADVATVYTYSSVSGCGGGYNCNLSVASIEESLGEIPLSCYY